MLVQIFIALCGVFLVVTIAEVVGGWAERVTQKTPDIANDLYRKG